MPLLDALYPIISAAKIDGLEVDEVDDLNVTIDGDVLITQDTRAKSGLFGPCAEIIYVVSFMSSTRHHQDEPPNEDVVEVGTYTSEAEAVASALGVIVQHRIAAYQDRLSDDEEGARLRDF